MAFCCSSKKLYVCAYVTHLIFPIKKYEFYWENQLLYINTTVFIIFCVSHVIIYTITILNFLRRFCTLLWSQSSTLWRAVSCEGPPHWLHCKQGGENKATYIKFQVFVQIENKVYSRRGAITYKVTAVKQLNADLPVGSKQMQSSNNADNI